MTHRRLRLLVEQAFIRHSVENLRGRIGVLCDGLLDGLTGKQTVDLLHEWAWPLPVAVIGELLGLPDADRPQFNRWANAFFSSMSVFGMLRAVPAMFRLVKYFRQHFEQCRQQPRPGLMTLALAVADSELRYAGNMAFRALVVLSVRLR
jgi:cytochrome P450